MRLTTFTDYGLRVLMRLASEPYRTFITREIAQEHGISRHHLVKVVSDLAEAGFITTRRGDGGGMQLARPADTITIGEVVRRLEARHALVDCFRAGGGSCVINKACKLKGRLKRAEEAFLADLDRSSLAECVGPTMNNPARAANQLQESRGRENS